jgi:predicted metal-binding protein
LTAALKGCFDGFMEIQTAIEAALAGRAHEFGVIETSGLSFSPELYDTCRTNVCGNYNKSWTCPPAVGSLEEQREKILRWKHALVFTTKFELEDSFDVEGMGEARRIHNRLTMDIRGKFSANPVYGAGGCSVCPSCAYPAPCRFPGRAISAVEAAGINVTELSRTAMVKYNNGPNTITYFSMILFNPGLLA